MPSQEIKPTAQPQGEHSFFKQTFQKIHLKKKRKKKNQNNLFNSLD